MKMHKCGSLLFYEISTKLDCQMSYKRERERVTRNFVTCWFNEKRYKWNSWKKYNTIVCRMMITRVDFMTLFSEFCFREFYDEKIWIKKLSWFSEILLFSIIYILTSLFVWFSQ